MSLVTGPGQVAVPSSNAILAARSELSDFVCRQASKTKRRVGFGFVGSPDAPNTYAKLRQAYGLSRLTRLSLSVSNENLKETLYLTRNADLALRFWHDVSHVERDCNFSTVQELDLGLYHVAVAKAEGLSPLSLQFLEADLVGQSLLYAAIKGYAINQLRFDLDVVTFGTADAIVLEKERQKLAAE